MWMGFENRMLNEARHQGCMLYDMSRAGTSTETTWARKCQGLGDEGERD